MKKLEENRFNETHKPKHDITNMILSPQINRSRISTLSDDCSGISGSVGEMLGSGIPRSYWSKEIKILNMKLSKVLNLLL